MSAEPLAAFPRTFNNAGVRASSHPLTDRRSSERKAVETALRAAGRAGATIAEIARACGLPVDVARPIVNTIFRLGLANNLTPEHRPCTYAWHTDREPSNATGATARVSPRAKGLYDGRELQPFTGRPGAMDAFTLPSLVDGKRVPRRAPLLISAPPEPRR
jgi:hypothetical protein